MASIIPEYNYDICFRLSYSRQVFINYRQNVNKYDGWVTEFAENLKKARYGDRVSQSNPGNILNGNILQRIKTDQEA